MVRFIFLIIFFLIIHNLSSAQDNEVLKQKQNPKNAIYATFGTFLFVNTIGIAYERNLLFRENAFLQSLWLKGRTTYMEDFDDDVNVYTDISTVFLLGKKKASFELGLGMGLIYFPGNSQFLPAPSFSAGYRYHKPGGGLILRTGLGYPDALYLSIGAAF